MVRRGRKPLAIRHVDGLSGSEQAKLRLETFLKTLHGEMSVPEACEVLGIGQARFHALRTQWLQEALGLLEPRPLGRPPRTVSTEQQQIAELQAEIQDLKHQRVVVEVRQELGRVMPYVLSGRSGDALQPAVAAQPERANGSLAAGASETSPPAGVDSGAMPASVDCKKGALIS